MAGKLDILAVFYCTFLCSEFMKYNKAEYYLTFGIYGWCLYDSYYRIYHDLITLAFASMLKQSTM